MKLVIQLPPLRPGVLPDGATRKIPVEIDLPDGYGLMLPAAIGVVVDHGGPEAPGRLEIPGVLMPEGGRPERLPPLPPV